MNQDSNASIALLMLDIASAKSSLCNMQHAYTAAKEEHHRTWSQLQLLKQECDNKLCTLQSGTPTRINAGAQQLQVLHTENLQLKALLKQEVAARQQTENKYAGLVQLLRSFGFEELLDANQVLSSPDRAPVDSSPQAHGGSCPAAVAAAAAAARDDHHSRASSHSQLLPSAAGSCASTQQPISSRSSASSSDFIAGTATAGFSVRASPTSRHEQANHKTELPAGTSSAKFNVSAFPPSAYFPQQSPATLPGNLPERQNAQQHQWWRVPGAAYAESTDHTARTTPEPQQQQRQQQEGFISASQHAWQQAEYAANAGSSSDPSMSPSNSSSQSQQSDTLDSEDMQELENLCDGLMGQQQGSMLGQSVHNSVTAAQPAAAIAAAAAGSGSDNRDRGSDHSHGLLSAAAADAAARVNGNRKHQQHKLTAGSLQHKLALHQQQAARIPSMEVLAAQLEQLQRQVAAVGLKSAAAPSIQPAADTTAAATTAGAAGSTGLGQAGSMATRAAKVKQHFSNPLPSVPSTQPHSRDKSQLTCGIPAASSTAGVPLDRAGGPSRVSSSDEPADAAASGMIGLQQQLAQRMEEVKQRLIGICNGMMVQEAKAAATTATGSIASPPPPPGAGTSVNGNMSTFAKPHQQAANTASSSAATWQIAAKQLDSSTHWAGSRSMPGSMSRGWLQPRALYKQETGGQHAAAALPAAQEPAAAEHVGELQQEAQQPTGLSHNLGCGPNAFEAAQACLQQASATGSSGCEDANSDSSWSTVEDDTQQQEQQQQQQGQQQQHKRSAFGQENQVYVADTACYAYQAASSSPSNMQPLSANGSTSGWQGDASILWRQQQQGVCVSLEGVLFGLTGRVAAEVAQTCSPLKAPQGEGEGQRLPRSPATPLRPHNGSE